MRDPFSKRSYRDHFGLQGQVEIDVRHGQKLIETLSYRNIILFQGNAEIIRTLSTISPTTTPRIINRMAIGDQGTIPADSTVPKIPTKDLTSLYHEIYRKDIDSRTVTLNPTGTSSTLVGALTIGSQIVTTISTTGVAIGMSVSGTGVQANTVVQSVNSGTQFTMSLPAVSPGGSQTLTISGAANECRFVTTFNAVDVALSAYSNPSQPRVNEVGLVFIDPTAPSGIVRATVTAPAAPPVDEVLASIRAFKSVPFEIANDVSITIRYTIFMQ